MCWPNFQGDDDGDYDDDLTKVDPLNEVCYLTQVLLKISVPSSHNSHHALQIKLPEFLTSFVLNLYETDQALFNYLSQVDLCITAT